MWRGSTTIPGASAAVGALRDAGHRVVFVTNDARPPAIKIERLDALGVASAEVVTSAEAASYACRDEPGRIAVLGERSLCELLNVDGHDAVDLRDESRPNGVGAVVVGSHADWDRSRIGWAAELIASGARFLATNDDPTFPSSEDGVNRLLPGNGALVAAVATASGCAPEVAGKPHAPMAALIEARFGSVDVVVGDQPATDGRFATVLDAAFALVLSGVTSAAELPTDPPAVMIGDDLAALVATLLAS